MTEETKFVVRINSQDDCFSSLYDAKAYAQKLLDAGVWFLELKKENAKNKKH